MDVIMSERINSSMDAIATRDKDNKIVIRTSKRLNDEQMRDLYALALLMCKTGKSMKDFFTVKTAQETDS